MSAWNERKTRASTLKSSHKAMNGTNGVEKPEPVITPPKKIWKTGSVLAVFATVRLISVFLVQSNFVPDEYWQSLEVAHRFTFGYGYLTWEWQQGIRSYIYPLLISGFYGALKLLTLDNALLLIYGPRICQALLSAYSDLCFYRWCGYKKWSVFTIASAWFWFYTGSRTLINTFETSLTIIALSQFPWPGSGKDDSSFKYLWTVAILSVIRPTGAILWVPIVFYHLSTTRLGVITVMVKKIIPIGLCVITMATVLDSWAHGSFISTPYQFVRFNLFEDVGSWYGSEPWYWYWTHAVPMVLGVQLVPFLLSVIAILTNPAPYKNEIAYLTSIVFTITVYSFLPHKEFRFLLPILPLMLNISANFLSTWSHKARTISVWLVAFAIFGGNLVPGFYVSFVHQRGTLDVMAPLRNASLTDTKGTSLLFLMPCHSTPYYSHLHVNVTARFLTCEPNFNKTGHYVDDADRFYANPTAWLRTNYPPNGTLPSHIICFDSLKPAIGDLLSRYRTTHEIFHTSFPTARVGRNVLINELIHRKASDDK